MRLDEIKIPEIYLKTPPKQWKLDACREYFGKFGHIDRRIVVDKTACFAMVMWGIWCLGKTGSPIVMLLSIRKSR